MYISTLQHYYIVTLLHWRALCITLHYITVVCERVLLNVQVHFVQPTHCDAFIYLLGFPA